VVWGGGLTFPFTKSLVHFLSRSLLNFVILLIVQRGKERDSLRSFFGIVCLTQRIAPSAQCAQNLDPAQLDLPA